MKPKNSLVRIIVADGVARVDLTGKANGRGVYLCKRRECLDKALKNKKFEKNYGFSLQEISDDLENLIEK
ncbi:MAG: YlxR family protein [Firmicutes bacterium]|nr:YlxR family protein [Bacillota bacterium]